MSWADSYEFGEDFADLRGDRQAASLLEQELAREVADGHPLHGRSWTVIARAFPQDDVVIQSGDEVAIVHLTWAQRPERLPWPMTEIFASAADFGIAIANRY